MNTIAVYLIEVAATLVICLAVVMYLRPHLRRILTDLCGTDERAQFWMVFSSILLVGLPLIFGMGYNPSESTSEMMFFDITHQLRWNLLGFLFSLVVIGAVVSFFALVAPRQNTK